MGEALRYTESGQVKGRGTDSLIVVEVLLESLTGLGMGRLMGNVWVLLVAGTLVILRAVSLPAAKTHPAEVMLTVAALHVVTATILLYADVTLGTLVGRKHRKNCQTDSYVRIIL